MNPTPSSGKSDPPRRGAYVRCAGTTAKGSRCKRPANHLHLGRPCCAYHGRWQYGEGLLRDAPTGREVAEIGARLALVGKAA